MELKSAENCVEVMATSAPVVFLNYLQFMSLPVHMKEITLCCCYRLVIRVILEFFLIALFGFYNSYGRFKTQTTELTKHAPTVVLLGNKQDLPPWC